MSRPDITWFCGECGYQRGEQHTCPPDEGETIASLVDALPRSPPSPAVREEAEKLSDLRRRARPDGLFVREPLLGWLLTGFSYLEVAGEKLRPYTAEGMCSAPAPFSLPPPLPPLFDIARARAVGQHQGQCPGILLDDGDYSGCGGGADCPVCLGKPFAAGSLEQQLADLRAQLAQAQEALDVARAGVLHTELEGEALRDAVRRHLKARDAAQPEAEKVARDEIERML